MDKKLIFSIVLGSILLLFFVFKTDMVQRYFAEPKYVTLEIKGMYSEACPKKIEDAVFNMKGVKAVKVDFAKKECRITYNPYFSTTPDFVEVINANGYISKKKSNLKVVDYKIQFQGAEYK